MVDACDYPDAAKNAITCDVLISGCKSSKAKDKFIQETGDLTLERAIAILQIEESNAQSLQNLNSTGTTSAEMHYARYDHKKKSGGKNVNSTSDKKCFHCGFAFIKEHLKSCPAKDADCNFCRVKGHFAKCCRKAGKFPKDGQKNSHSGSKKDDSEEKKSMHTLHSIQEEGTSIYYDEDGNVKFKT